ncbi:EcsC family protein [Halodesulfovibrio sp.]|jgi:hypothetical protein|uniref:EcsC family protein n=1 Tax=Halodesulfovibrio sp. TaxID=1912772 RepID=UPI0025D7BA89|nr:EcsC family protein [Halodesulfovibrio sp.]MCT4626579.1 EcsC family protein [Halodesulfovibrio sp.]
MNTMTISDIGELKRAKMILENPGFAMKAINYLGMPIEKGLEALPKKVMDTVQVGLEKAADAALFSMKDLQGESKSNYVHKAAVATTGAVGGFLGIEALVVELPISTTIMLRSIADIARSHGESLADIEVKFECLKVFALGGRSASDDAAESSYWTIRNALGKVVSEATAEVASRVAAADAASAAASKAVNEAAEQVASKNSSSVLVKLIESITERYGISVSEKVLAQAVPVVGALGGAAINTMFIDHFQDMAEGHFIVRKLERTYGSEIVRETYRAL